MLNEHQRANGIVISFGIDHGRLWELWRSCSAALDSRAAPALKRDFFEFERALRLHMKAEEKVLVPVLEETAAMRGWGPLDAVRSEHRMLEEELDKLSSFMLAAEDAELIEGFQSRSGEFVNKLLEHAAAEERVLYPMADLTFTARQLRTCRLALSSQRPRA